MFTDVQPFPQDNWVTPLLKFRLCLTQSITFVILKRHFTVTYFCNSCKVLNLNHNDLKSQKPGRSTELVLYVLQQFAYAVICIVKV